MQGFHEVAGASRAHAAALASVTQGRCTVVFITIVGVQRFDIQLLHLFGEVLLPKGAGREELCRP